jgi:hypothetical protein
MITVYNPLTGEWERLDDVVRPLPVIARDTRLVAVNDTTSFIPTLATSSSASHIDFLGSTNGNRANIGIAVGSTDADILIPDPWRIRRIIVLFQRTASGGTGVTVGCSVFGRLLAPDGTPSVWRRISEFTDAGSSASTLRAAIPTSLAGVQGFDQYRITFRRDPDSTPTPELSLIRVYAEF